MNHELILINQTQILHQEVWWNDWLDVMMFLFVFQRGILDIFELNKLGDGPFWVNNKGFFAVLCNDCLWKSCSIYWTDCQDEYCEIA